MFKGHGFGYKTSREPVPALPALVLLVDSRVLISADDCQDGRVVRRPVVWMLWLRYKPSKCCAVKTEGKPFAAAPELIFSSRGDTLYAKVSASKVANFV